MKGYKECGHNQSTYISTNKAICKICGKTKYWIEPDNKWLVKTTNK